MKFILDLKIYGTKDNPLFLAKDVAEWIENANVSQMIEDAQLDESEIDKKIIDISYRYGSGLPQKN